MATEVIEKAFVENTGARIGTPWRVQPNNEPNIKVRYFASEAAANEDLHLQRNGGSTKAPNVKLEDIPTQTGINAHSGTSHSPEDRAVSEQKSYVLFMERVFEQMTARAKTAGEKAKVPEEFEQFRQNWVDRKLGLLRRRSGLVSVLVAGPSKFPVRQMNKRSESLHKAEVEFGAWEQKAQKRALESISPSPSKIISADSPTATTDLQAKIDKAKDLQERMIAANKIVRSKKLSDDEKVTQLTELKLTESNARELLKGDFIGRKGFPDWQTSNNRANIKRMEARIVGIEREKSRPEPAEGGITFQGGTIEENKDLNRLQILFDEKPNVETRTKLKRAGFRWSPREGAWQRQLNQSARNAANEILGVKKEPTDEVIKKSVKSTEVKVLATDIIAKDTISGTNYEFRVAKVTREGPEHNIQIRATRRTGGFSDWESASMGFYHSEKEALEAFTSRYRNGDFEPVHPIIVARVEKRDREAKQIEEGRTKAAAKAIEDEKINQSRRTTIEDEFKKAKFVKGAADLIGPSGKIGEVTGPSIGGMVIHKVSGERRIKDVEYQITHIKSGFAIGPQYFTQKDAKIAAFRLSQHGDFTKGADQLPNNIPFTTLANRMKLDSFADFSDKVPTTGASNLPAAKKSEFREKVAALKEKQEKRRKEIASKTPTGTELLQTSPTNLTEKFLLPRDKEIQRSTAESNRLVETTLNAIEASDKVAIGSTHPSLNVVNNLFNRMTKDEQESLLKLVPEKQIPFWEKFSRQRIAKEGLTVKKETPTLEERKASMLERIQTRTREKLGPEIIREFSVSHPFRKTKTVKAEFTVDALNEFARTEGISENDKDRITVKLISEPKSLSARKKETPSLSFRAAEARFERKTAGTGRSKQRNPALDEQRQAKVVAPAVAKTEEDLKLQRRWFKNPNQLDFEGVDTKKEKPKAKIKSSKL